MATQEHLDRIPPAPFATDGGTGQYATDAALKADVDIARRIMNDPRWPISASLRERVVRWLESVLENATDDRARVNAMKTLIAADKLNLEQAKLLLECEKAQKPASTGPTINITGDNVGISVFERIDTLTAAFAGAADRQGEGTVPSDDPGKSVDT
jgi:hypothetical protein